MKRPLTEHVDNSQSMSVVEGWLDSLASQIHGIVVHTRQGKTMVANKEADLP